MLDSKFVRVLFAGLWFAVAAAIPVVYVVVRFDEISSFFGNSLTVTIMFPILLSGICGSLLGSSIFDAGEIKNEFQATLRGLMVAALSYLLMFTIPAIIVASGISDLSQLIGTFGFFVFIFVYGLLFVGWLAAAVGAVAGLFLYLYRVKIIDGRTN